MVFMRCVTNLQPENHANFGAFGGVSAFSKNSIIDSTPGFVSDNRVRHWSKRCKIQQNTWFRSLEPHFSHNSPSTPPKSQQNPMVFTACLLFNLPRRGTYPALTSRLARATGTSKCTKSTGQKVSTVRSWDGQASIVGPYEWEISDWDPIFGGRFGEYMA